MSLMRTMGKLGARVWGNKEFISGVMQGLDPSAVAAAVNENASFMGKVMKDLDPKAITDTLDESLEFASEILKSMAFALAAGRGDRLGGSPLSAEPTAEQEQEQ